MDKEEIIKSLKVLYEEVLNQHDFALCFKILQEIIAVKNMKEFYYDIK